MDGSRDLRWIGGHSIERSDGPAAPIRFRFLVFRRTPSKASLSPHLLCVMHGPHEFLELAAVISCHGPQIVLGSQRLPSAGMGEYWTSAKCRVDRWGRELKRATTHTGPNKVILAIDEFDSVKPLMEEVFFSEPLARVWAAIAAAHDRRVNLIESEPLARSVFIGHMEARNRCLKILTGPISLHKHAAAQLDRRRRMLDRWSDLLIGYLLEHETSSTYAVRPERARRFYIHFRHTAQRLGNETAKSLLISSLRTNIALTEELSQDLPNRDLNHRIAAAILACLEPSLFDDSGPLRCHWSTRLLHAANEMETMLDELHFSPERSAGHDEATELAHYWRQFIRRNESY